MSRGGNRISREGMEGVKRDSFIWGLGLPV